MSLPNKTLAFLGAIYGVSLVFKLFRFLQYWTRSSSISRYNYLQTGTNSSPWALITGASDGIGLALALELASKNFNIILHGRNPTKLSTAQSLITSSYPNIQVRIIIIDACLSGDLLLAKISQAIKEIKNLHITLLINNIGGLPPGMNPLYKTLSQTPAREIDDILSVNIRFTCHLTSLLIPHFPKSQPALIMNIGAGAKAGLPYLAMYSGTKGFVDSWTVALAREMKAEGRDVGVLCVTPMKVTGTSTRKEVVTFTMPDTRMFARTTLGRVGGGRILTAGYWSHNIMANMTTIFTEWLLQPMILKAVREEAEKDKKWA